MHVIQSQYQVWLHWGASKRGVRCCVVALLRCCVVRCCVVALLRCCVVAWCVGALVRWCVGALVRAVHMWAYTALTCSCLGASLRRVSRLGPCAQPGLRVHVIGLCWSMATQPGLQAHMVGSMVPRPGLHANEGITRTPQAEASHDHSSQTKRWLHCPCTYFGRGPRVLVQGRLRLKAT